MILYVIILFVQQYCKISGLRNFDDKDGIAACINNIIIIIIIIIITIIIIIILFIETIKITRYNWQNGSKKL